MVIRVNATRFPTLCFLSLVEPFGAGLTVRTFNIRDDFPVLINDQEGPVYGLGMHAVPHYKGVELCQHESLELFRRPVPPIGETRPRPACIAEPLAGRRR
jgi:hypothetical protein